MFQMSILRTALELRDMPLQDIYVQVLPGHPVVALMERDRVVVYLGRDIYQPVQVTPSLRPIKLVFECLLHGN